MKIKPFNAGRFQKGEGSRSDKLLFLNLNSLRVGIAIKARSIKHYLKVILLSNRNSPSLSINFILLLSKCNCSIEP